MDSRKPLFLVGLAAGSRSGTKMDVSRDNGHVDMNLKRGSGFHLASDKSNKMSSDAFCCRKDHDDVELLRGPAEGLMPKYQRDSSEQVKNRWQFYFEELTIQTLALTNSFKDVYIGWPGRTHDARVLSNSDLFITAEERQNGYLFPREKSKMLDGVGIPVHIVADAAYPLKQWLTKGFTRIFNFHKNKPTSP
ncbi:hypothetical protein F2P81_014490 [Scophthalmus maximus]|uniref:DDE Tnp4 domain-containing protein n=1 Tax=Scophthalmus maximus TaxID=52904 RepID=A0A6A4SK08_SCOMX|nr:hypothetical protein F2P81_014490 [Scophthalmus maximus]